MSPINKLSWNQIKNQYPDEWVILVDVDVDVDVDESTNVTAGLVYDHSPDKKYVNEKQKDLPGEVAVLYTGEIKAHPLGLGHIELEPST